MPHYVDSMSDRSRQQVAAWLILCCAMIFAMVVLGGVTRLTGSGLSMVEWNPIFGFIPPLNEQQWAEVFEKYRGSPEYQKINIGMDLEGFKSIYWFEFGHRVLGRLIGTVFLLPFLYFLVRGMLGRPLVPRLFAAFILGGLQGVLGWYMVKSGLIDNPHVSQYRLTAHLSLALLIYAYLLWLVFSLLFPDPGRRTNPSGLKNGSLLLLVMISITIVSGGFVAGIKAGLAYNTFPKMGDQWVPQGMWMLEPGWRNLFENITTVQFDHRLLATLTFFAVAVFWLYAVKQWRFVSPGARLGSHLLLLAAITQVSLGISTLLLHVPVALGAAHQAGALVLLTAVLFLYHRFRYA
ncbi:MAG: COX15/CtaA family protein [Thiogranum sp.]|nr:COX15/CtaA family protein [Thiogranum sp.]